jgi:hypothetical protein
MVPVHELPSGYRETLHFVLTEGRRVLWLNLMALVPIVIAIIVVTGWWIIIAPIRIDQTDFQLPIPLWLGAVVTFILILPIHELLHGIAIQFVGHHARYGMDLSKGVLYATADQALFRRNEYIFVALAPFIGITLAGMALLIVVPSSLTIYISLAIVLNAGGAIGDLWTVFIILHYPSSALVRDEGDGFRVYISE